MKEIKVSEASGLVLDYLVAICEGGTNFFFEELRPSFKLNGEGKFLANGRETWWFHPSTNWAQSGLIIERERIEVIPPIHNADDQDWMSTQVDDDDLVHLTTGPTPLIAAMRCYVTSKMGDEVEIPEELLK